MNSLCTQDKHARHVAMHGCHVHGSFNCARPSRHWPINLLALDQRAALKRGHTCPGEALPSHSLEACGSISSRPLPRALTRRCTSMTSTSSPQRSLSSARGANIRKHATQLAQHTCTNSKQHCHMRRIPNTRGSRPPSPTSSPPPSCPCTLPWTPHRLLPRTARHSIRRPRP